jgi:predicted secreted protein
MKDKRSRNLVAVVNCILNQNAKVDGIAEYPGVVEPVINLLVSKGVGILQIPCPEFTHSGPRRWWCVKEQYNNMGFKSRCAQIARSISDEIEEYSRNDYKVLCIIGADGSPSCGIKTTCTSKTYGGEPADKKARPAKGSGVFIEILQNELKSRGIRIPMIGVPESGTPGPPMNEVLNEIVSLIKAGRR